MPYVCNKKKSDRFIPNRRTSKLNLAFSEAHETDENRPVETNKGK